MAGAAGFLSFCPMYYSEACLNRGLISRARESFLAINPWILREKNRLSAETERLEALIALAEGADPAAVAAQLDRVAALATRRRASLFLRKISEARA